VPTNPIARDEHGYVTLAGIQTTATRFTALSNRDQDTVTSCPDSGNKTTRGGSPGSQEIDHGVGKSTCHMNEWVQWYETSSALKNWRTFDDKDSRPNSPPSCPKWMRA